MLDSRPISSLLERPPLVPRPSSVRGHNPSIVLRNIIEGNRPDVIELRPDASGRLADLIERLLETDPNDRPNNAEDVVAELERALAEVKIDRDDEKWSLRAWLQDPASYGQRLDDHLKAVLLAEGKAKLKARSPRSAAVQPAALDR